MKIKNIHIIRKSSRKLQTLCNPGINDKNWTIELRDTKWLKYIHVYKLIFYYLLQSILKTTAVIVDTIARKNSPVLIFENNGWDATSQVFL